MFYLVDCLFTVCSHFEYGCYQLSKKNSGAEGDVWYEVGKQEYEYFFFGSLQQSKSLMAAVAVHKSAVVASLGHS